MTELTVFVSVGTPATEQQEVFVRAVEDRLRSEGIVPHTVGRNTFSAEAPLKTVTKLIDKCSGAVVIALERSFFPSGIDKRGGSKESSLANIKLPTPWNHIEAAMAYSRGLPLLIIVESGLKSEGLLEHGYDWYVQYVTPESSALNSSEFNGVLASWKEKLKRRGVSTDALPSISELTIGELIARMKPAQLWSALGGVGVLIAGAFALGGKLFGAQ